MTTTLEGSTALVTGATAGIGRAVALQLGQLGAEVIVHGRSAERGAKRRGADLFRVLRQDPFSVPRLWLFPFSKALRQLCLRNFDPKWRDEP